MERGGEGRKREREREREKEEDEIHKYKDCKLRHLDTFARL